MPGSSFLSNSIMQYYTSSTICSCDDDIDCTLQAKFYNFSGYNAANDASISTMTPQLSVLFTIPGLMIGCLPYNSLLLSTLECFYDSSCIEQMRNYIPSFSTVSPLSSSRFNSSTKVNTLLDQLFVEVWNAEHNFSAYYKVCSPSSCTYSYERRLNILYAIVTVISLLGGLNMIMYISAPIITRIIRRITTIEMLFYDRRSDPIDGLYSTRLYFLLLLIGIVVLLFCTSFFPQLYTVTVNQPSIDKCKQLSRRDFTTLICPCTHLSVPYSSIIDLNVRYHQVCTSDFIKNDGWMLYFNKRSTPLYTLDFRVQGGSLFAVLQILCQMSNETVTNELTTFNNMQFVGTHVLSNDVFNEQIYSLIQQFQQQTMKSFLDLFKQIQTSIQLNQFIIHGQTNAVLRYTGTPYNRTWFFASVNTYDNNCSCGLSALCTRPQGFYCTTDSCKLNTIRPNQTIPGFVLSCLPVDSLLFSSLQCLYNASCIQMLIQWKSFGTANSTIDPRVINVIPLDISVNSRFALDVTVNNIASQLFIEEWINATNYSSYYQQCAPQKCTYTYMQRFNHAYVIARVLGIIGGLSVALRILTPLVVKVIRRTHHFCRTCRDTEDDVTVERSMRRKLSAVAVQLQYSVRKMNFYQERLKHHPSQELSAVDQMRLNHRLQIASRVYVISFVITFVNLTAFTAFTPQTHVTEVSSPTQSIFDSLREQYSLSLTCPCSQVSIPNSEFLFIQPTAYHQVCSSYFVSSDFINSIWVSDTSSTFVLFNDGKVISSQFRLLSLLCSLAKNITEQQMNVFLAQKLVTLETLTWQSFQTRIDSLVNNFINETPARFQQLHVYINDILHANQLHNLFFTNWNLKESSAKDGYYILTNSILYNETGQPCSCDVSPTCSRSILVNGKKKENFTGLVCGCLPIYGLRQSTLECFYDMTCLNRLFSFISTASVAVPLNLSISICFTPIASVPIGTLIDELFIESWSNTSNYSSYCSRCAPLTCRYTHVDQINLVYMITTFLGFYGGLTIGLKSIVWCSLSLYWKAQHWFIVRRTTVEPAHGSIWRIS
ncbi:unnamed protein product [Adineta ricciae]|uniref:Uncharacterized protein n=1 Tax=Adineta ricciae TaxID=249248 RepID=A0A815RYJ1_ADIRI|nr:unnamed protein product [Adineta ricciae]